MPVSFDRWTFLKIVEVCFCIACLTCKRVTDDEASRLFLYLQKLSREWSLLNNVTWDRIGSAVADAAYGGYIIITSALLIGRIFGELPTKRRIVEIILLLIGAFLFVVLGGLELAALESVPSDLVDNAAILGTLSLVTAALFLLDIAGPKGKSEKGIQHIKVVRPEIQLIEKQIEPQIIKKTEVIEVTKIPNGKEANNFSNGVNMNIVYPGQNGLTKDKNSYKKMKDKPKKFDIYGKDVDSDTDEETKDEEEHSPVWSKIREGQYGKYEVNLPTFWQSKSSNESYDRPPSSPGDPGYVQYTAKRWGQQQYQTKTPRQSPTEV
ncbi:hypothetical protein AMK59_8146 [Oryctes borbonicus]|uniref:Uncharacterized protein n=1 Tax=Oryctes borbonicus TaxID=1629725 RepID=A0A0T6AZS9_9SCAR|nr:hypothetical protein AMK59_8146 [Oryctes borbonicus]